MRIWDIIKDTGDKTVEGKEKRKGRKSGICTLKWAVKGKDR